MPVHARFTIWYISLPFLQNNNDKWSNLGCAENMNTRTWKSSIKIKLLDNPVTRCSALPSELWRPIQWQAGEFVEFKQWQAGQFGLLAIVWVFIAQMVEHCSANAEATGLNPVEAPKNFFFGLFRNCLCFDTVFWRPYLTFSIGF